MVLIISSILKKKLDLIFEFSRFACLKTRNLDAESGYKVKGKRVFRVFYC